MAREGLDETMVCACGPRKKGCGTNGFDAKARATSRTPRAQSLRRSVSAASVFALVSPALFADRLIVGVV